jgi:hypothetical protein
MAQSEWRLLSLLRTLSDEQLSRLQQGQVNRPGVRDDSLLCCHCGRRMTVIAFVVKASEIKKILAYVGFRRKRQSSTQREGRRKVIYGITQLRANGE